MIYQQNSRAQKYKDFIVDKGMNVYVVCITAEVLVYLFYMMAYFLEVTFPVESKDVDLKTIIMSLMMVVSMVSIYQAIARDNVYALFQFLLLQGVFNYCIAFKFDIVYHQPQSIIRTPAWQTALQVTAILTIIVASLSFILFNVFAYAIYSNNKFKIYNRVGALPSNIAGYRLYKTTKNLSLTFVEFFIVNNVLYYFYQKDVQNIVLHCVIQLVVLAIYRLFNSAVTNEHALRMHLCLLIFLAAQIYKTITMGIFLSDYNWTTCIYSFSDHAPQEIFNSSVVLYMTIELINCLVVILLCIVTKNYLNQIGTGLKSIINPQLAKKELQSTLIP